MLSSNGFGEFKNFSYVFGWRSFCLSLYRHYLLSLFVNFHFEFAIKSKHDSLPKQENKIYEQKIEMVLSIRKVIVRSVQFFYVYLPFIFSSMKRKSSKRNIKAKVDKQRRAQREQSPRDNKIWMQRRRNDSINSTKFSITFFDRQRVTHTTRHVLIRKRNIYIQMESGTAINGVRKVNGTISYIPPLSHASSRIWMLWNCIFFLCLSLLCHVHNRKTFFFSPIRSHKCAYIACGRANLSIHYTQ